jgi:hypothetical protein
MIDSLLYAVRDAIRAPVTTFTGNPITSLGYDERSCEIMPDGRPKPNCGEVFVSVCEDTSRSTNDNCLMEYFAFSVTLTQRVVKVPLDRVGDSMLAVKVARQTGHNRRCEALRALLHMNWGALQDANDYLVRYSLPGTGPVYGFCEPARFRAMSRPRFEGGDWLGADADAPQICLATDLQFADARRFQGIATYV